MRDPMESYEQAEAEADERFYEERDDADAAITAAEANRIRRKALWNARCRCHGPLEHCACINTCETCGHIRADHDYDYATDTGASYGCCDVDDCICQKFELGDE